MTFVSSSHIPIGLTDSGACGRNDDVAYVQSAIAQRETNTAQSFRRVLEQQNASEPAYSKHTLRLDEPREEEISTQGQSLTRKEESEANQANSFLRPTKEVLSGSKPADPQVAKDQEKAAERDAGFAPRAEEVERRSPNSISPRDLRNDDLRRATRNNEHKDTSLQGKLSGKQSAGLTVVSSHTDGASLQVQQALGATVSTAKSFHPAEHQKDTDFEMQSTRSLTGLELLPSHKAKTSTPQQRSTSELHGSSLSKLLDRDHSSIAKVKLSHKSSGASPRLQPSMAKSQSSESRQTPPKAEIDNRTKAGGDEKPATTGSSIPEHIQISNRRAESTMRPLGAMHITPAPPQTRWMTNLQDNQRPTHPVPPISAHEPSRPPSNDTGKIDLSKQGQVVEELQKAQATVRSDSLFKDTGASKEIMARVQSINPRNNDINVVSGNEQPARIQHKPQTDSRVAGGQSSRDFIAQTATPRSQQTEGFEKAETEAQRAFLDQSLQQPTNKNSTQIPPSNEYWALQNKASTNGFEMLSDQMTDGQAQSFDPSLNDGGTAPDVNEKLQALHTPKASFATPKGIAKQLMDHTIQLTDDGQTIEVTLTPEELGKVRLVFDKHSAVPNVIVHADRPETLDFLRRNHENLQQHFENSGHQELTFSFSDGDSHHNQSAKPENTTPDDTPQPVEVSSRKLGSSGMDLRL